MDATRIAAPPSTKNMERKRDPQDQSMVFGMKAHLGVDQASKLVHTVVVTTANVADITKPAARRHGQETQVHADAGYTGVEQWAEIVALARPIDWQIARQTGADQTAGSRRGASQTLRQSVRRTIIIFLSQFAQKILDESCRNCGRTCHVADVC